MAFNSRRINPLDLQPRKAIGVALPFSGEVVFNSTFQTKDAIKANIVNFFLTGPRERYLNPQLGSPIRQLIFNTINEEFHVEIENVVRQGFSQYFPNVRVNNIEVTSQPDNNITTLAINYSIQDTNIEDEVVINFEQ